MIIVGVEQDEDGDHGCSLCDGVGGFRYSRRNKRLVGCLLSIQAQHLLYRKLNLLVYSCC